MEGAPEEISWENFLEVKFTDISAQERVGTLMFSVAPNFNIFISKTSHEYLSDAYGVDGDETLAEGYITFNSDGSIGDVLFKYHSYQPHPGFSGSTEDLTKLKEAVETKIRTTFSDLQRIQNDDLLLE